VEPVRILTTGAGALVFAATFLAGGRVHPLQPFLGNTRRALSFGAGMSAAYVFVHLMPELHAAREAFAGSVGFELRFEGMAIYYLALVGFLVFYGLDVMRGKLRESEDPAREAKAFRFHIGGFAAYVVLMAYLLVHNLEATRISTALYTIPMVCHFLSLDHSLQIEHGALYEKRGRPLLAAMSILGWGLGLLITLPAYVLALLVAFISGAIIMNNTIMEMPSEKDGRFVPFMIGGLAYGLVLVPLG